jgi:hypothetical protein
MARVEYNKCDRCEKYPAKTCGTFVKRRMDGAGSMEDCHLLFDLCFSCSCILLNEALENLGVDEAKLLLSRHEVETREG